MSENNEQRGDEEVLSEDDHIRNYFRALVELDRAMEPLRESGKALRANYVENGWLEREQMSMILRAYRANKNQLDMEMFNDMVDMVKREMPKV